jgi:ATP:ADP antiporter, AAA family
VVARDEKYKAKNMIDVVVLRGSDALYAPVFDLLQTLGLKIGGIALCALPVAIAWFALSMRLGRSQERRAIEIAAVAARTDSTI